MDAGSQGLTPPEAEMLRRMMEAGVPRRPALLQLCQCDWSLEEALLAVGWWMEPLGAEAEVPPPTGPSEPRASAGVTSSPNAGSAGVAAPPGAAGIAAPPSIIFFNHHHK